MEMIDILSQNNTNIIDVRESYEFQYEHAKGAINIPLSTFMARISDIQSMEGSIVLYCKSGNRSGQAARVLNELGVENAYNGGSLYEIKHLQTLVSS